MAKRCIRPVIVFTLTALMVFSVWSLAPATPAVAQSSTCPEIVKTAFQQTAAQCARTGRNKTCYGNLAARVSFNTGFENAKFEKPGDVVDLNAIRSLSLSPMDLDAPAWGVILMRLQANLPDSEPNEAVTMIIFGSVTVTDAKAIPEANVPNSFQPMQAFYLKSSGRKACQEAPKEGVLIQTPKGKKKVELWINGAEVKIGSTAFVETLVDGEWSLNVLEGTAEVKAGGVTRLGLPGERIWVPMSAGLLPRGPAREVQPYNPAAANNALPLDLLPRKIEIVEPRPNTPADGRQEEGEEGTIVDGILQTVRGENPTVIVVAGVAFEVPNADLLREVQRGEPVRAIGTKDGEKLILTSITSLLDAPKMGRFTELKEAFERERLGRER